MRYAIALNHHTDWDSVDRKPGYGPNKKQTVLLRDRLKYIYLTLEICKKHSGFDPKDIYFILAENSNWYVYDLIGEINEIVLDNKMIVISNILRNVIDSGYVGNGQRQYADAYMKFRCSKICQELGVEYIFHINARYVPVGKNFFKNAVDRLEKSNKLIEFIPWNVFGLNDPMRMTSSYLIHNIKANSLHKFAMEYTSNLPNTMESSYYQYYLKNSDECMINDVTDFTMWNNNGTWFDGPHPGAYYIDEIIELIKKLNLLDDKIINNILKWRYKPTIRIGRYYYRPEFYYPYPYDFKKEKGWDLDPIFANYE